MGRWFKSLNVESWRTELKNGLVHLKGCKIQGTHATGKTGKTGKMAKKNPCHGKHREFRNLVCSGCKFPDSKGKICFDFCHENFHFFRGAG